MLDIYKEIHLTPGEKIEAIKFRDKESYGYDYSQMSMKTDKKYIHEGIESDIYLRAFFSGLSVRPSCFSCHFKKRYRVSDITMWDCLTPYKYDKSLDNNKGVTRILTHSKEGYQIIKKLKNVNSFEIDVNKTINGVHELVETTKYNSNRTIFMKDLRRMSSKELVNKWYHETFRIKIVKNAKRFLNKVGIYSEIKRLAKLALRK